MKKFVIFLMKQKRIKDNWNLILDDTRIIKRLTLQDIYLIKLKCIEKIEEIEKIQKEINDLFDSLEGYTPVRLDNKYNTHGKNRSEKYTDRTCWRLLIQMFELKKYMLCTKYDKMSDDIENFNFPVFNIENANGWINDLKNVIYENVTELCKQVFENITNDCYYTGSGYSNREKKKRNNNGIDNFFILTTYDYSNIFGYHWNRPTVTDDLEKCCYILDGKTLPDSTIKDKMRSEKINECANDYFNIKVCKNGNTHYKIINNNIINKLNKIGAGNSKIGEDIKIKVFDNRVKL